MITVEEIKVLDRNSEYYGVSTLRLMENAGKGVADFIIDRLDPVDKNIVVFCGTGNNGGDGFVASRYLCKNYNVSVFVAGGKIKTDIAKNNFDRLKKLRVKIYSSESEIDGLVAESDIIIDSMLGVGVSGRLKEPFSTIVNKINASKSDKIVISVDVPTGFGTDLVLKPDYTVTFHDVKKDMNRDNCGEIHIVDIGIPEEASTYVGPGEIFVYYPRPEKESHKGDNGVVLVIGGGPYVGAPALSGMAALRTGADLAFIVTPQRCFQPIASFSPNLIVKDLKSNTILKPQDLPLVKELGSRCTAAVIGPGLGNAEETEKAVIDIVEFLTSQNKPLVIDADAIKPVGEKPEVVKNTPTVITPHKGEFKKLTGVHLPRDVDAQAKTVSEWAEKLGVTIFLKGPIDILSNGRETRLNKIHNEAMTVGGTGDVLTGIIGGLLSKGVNPFNAVRMAAFINGEAGNRSFEKKSYGLLATDIVEEIPCVLKKYLQSSV